MVNTILTVIRSGRFSLEKIIERITYYHVNGELTNEEKDMLIQAARNAAVDTIGVDARKEILALWEEVRKLQKEVEELKSKIEPEPEPEPDVIPEYVQPTGAHDAYNTGDKVRFEGEVYVCMINNCVWSPAVYPAGWQRLLQKDEE